MEAWANCLATALHKRGENVRLYKGGGKAEVPFEEIVPCLQRHAQNTLRLFQFLPSRFIWRLGFGSPVAAEQTTFALRLIPRIRRNPADVVHVQEALVGLILHRAYEIGITRTPVILGHGTNETLQFLNKFQFLQHLAPSHREEARLAGVDRETWTVIPNFVDIERYHPGRNDQLRQELGIPAQAAVVLCVSCVDKSVKRIDYLFQEVASLLRSLGDGPEIFLVLAGAWHSESPGLIQMGRALLGDRIRLLIDWPKESMPGLYRVADVFALCSLKEMMSVALTEAVASGLPTIVHSHPVMEWIVGPGGIAVDMSNAGALSSALGMLIADSVRREQLSASARIHCVEHFSQESVVDQILEYYKFVAKTRQRRSVMSECTKCK